MRGGVKREGKERGKWKEKEGKRRGGGRRGESTIPARTPLHVCSLSHMRTLKQHSYFSAQVVAVSQVTAPSHHHHPHHESLVIRSLLRIHQCKFPSLLPCGLLSWPTGAPSLFSSSHLEPLSLVTEEGERREE